MDEIERGILVGLTSRMEHLERELALYRLIATYGPSVDSGSAVVTAALWTGDGIYDYGDDVLRGTAEIEAMVEGPRHQALIHDGVAHMLGLPLIQIDDEKATVTCYSQVCRRDGDGFRLWRVSANRWEMVWTTSGWKVERRSAYMLDGEDRARLLLGQAVTALNERPA